MNSRQNETSLIEDNSAAGTNVIDCSPELGKKLHLSKDSGLRFPQETGVMGNHKCCSNGYQGGKRCRDKTVPALPAPEMMVFIFMKNGLRIN